MSPTVTFDDRTIRSRASGKQWLLFAGLALAFLAILFSTSCAGTAARSNALMPAIQQAWPGVKQDVDNGVAAVADQLDDATKQSIADSEGRLDAGIKSGDRSKVSRDDWGNIRMFVGVGLGDQVSKGLLGPDVAESLMERTRQFDAAVTLLNAK